MLIAFRKYLTVLSLAIVCSGILSAASVQWVGGHSTSWGDPANWSTGVMPGPDDQVHFSGQAQGRVVIDVIVSVDAITTHPDFAYNIKQYARVDVAGNMILGGGRWYANDQEIHVGGDWRTPVRAEVEAVAALGPFVADPLPIGVFNRGTSTVALEGTAILTGDYVRNAFWHLHCGKDLCRTDLASSAYARTVRLGDGELGATVPDCTLHIGYGAENMKVLVTEGVRFKDEGGAWPALSLTGRGHVTMDGGDFGKSKVTIHPHGENIFYGQASMSLTGDVHCGSLVLRSHAGEAAFNTHGHDLHVAQSLNVGGWKYPTRLLADGSNVFVGAEDARTAVYTSSDLSSIEAGNSQWFVQGTWRERAGVQNDFTNAAVSFLGDNEIPFEEREKVMLEFAPTTHFSSLTIQSGLGLVRIGKHGLSADTVRFQGAVDVQVKSGALLACQDLFIDGGLEHARLASTRAKKQWFLNCSGTNGVSAVDVQGCDASAGTEIFARESSIDGGFNINWVFVTGMEWDGEGEDSLWSNPFNWTGDRIPSANDDVTFSDLSIKDCVIDVPARVASLRISEPYTGTIEQVNVVESIGSLYLSGGLWEANDQELICGGNLLFTQESTVFNRGISTVHMVGSGLVQNAKYQNGFHDFFIADAGEQVTLIDQVRVHNALHFGQGTVIAQGPKNRLFSVGSKAKDTQVLYNDGATFSDEGGAVTSFILFGSGDISFAGGDYGSSPMGPRVKFPSTSRLLSNITCGKFSLHSSTTLGQEFSTDGFDMTINGQLRLGWQGEGAVFKSDGSTIVIKNKQQPFDIVNYLGDAAVMFINEASAIEAGHSQWILQDGGWYNKTGGRQDMAGSTVIFAGERIQDIKNLNPEAALFDNVIIETDLARLKSDVYLTGDLTIIGKIAATQFDWHLVGNMSQMIDLNGALVSDVIVENNQAEITFSTGFTAIPGAVVRVVPGASLFFGAGETFTLDEIHWKGTETNPITLASTESGAQWKLVVAENDVAYVQVSDSDATNSRTPILAYKSLDYGNNYNWLFLDETPDLAFISDGASYTSPAWVEGWITSDVQSLTAQALRGEDQEDIYALRLDKNRWAALESTAPQAIPGVSLRSSHATLVEVEASNGERTVSALQSFTWTALDFGGYAPNELVIRQGDSLLFVCTGGWEGKSVRMQVKGGVNRERIIWKGRQGEFWEKEFDQPGTYIATCRVRGESYGQTFNITVIGIDLPDFVAVELGYERIVPVTILPKDKTEDVVLDGYAGADVNWLPSAHGSNNTYATLTVNAKGTPYIVPRIGENGPAVIVREVEEFKRERIEEGDWVFLKERYEDGAKLYQAWVAIDEMVTNVDVRIEVLTAGVTLLDSTTVKWGKSEEFEFMPNDGEFKDRYEYGYYMYKEDGTNSSVCHSDAFYQDGYRISQ